MARMKARLLRVMRVTGIVLGCLALAWMALAIFLYLTQGPRAQVFGIWVSQKDLPGTLLQAGGLGVLGVALAGWTKWFGALLRKLGRDWRGPVILWAGLSLVSAGFTLWNIRFMGITGLDTAIFENIIWNISRGNLSPQFMGIHHPYFIFYPFGLIYRFTGMAGVVLIYKLVIFSSVASAWLLARALGLKDEGPGLAALLGGFTAGMLRLVGQGPYPDLALLSLGLLFLWAGLRRRLVLAGIIGFSLFLFHEEAGLILAALSAALALLTRKKAWLWLVPVGIVAVVGALWFQGFVAPGRAESRMLSRYGVEGFGIWSLLQIGMRAFWPSRIFAFVRLMLQAGYLAFLELPIALLGIIPAAPQLAVTSTGTFQSTLGFYHGFYSLPLVVGAAILALRKLRDIAFHGLATVGIILLMRTRILLPERPPSWFVREADAFCTQVRADSVAASPLLSLRLSKRPYLRIVQGPDEVEDELSRHRPWVVVDTLVFRDMPGTDSLLNARGYHLIRQGFGMFIYSPP